MKTNENLKNLRKEKKISQKELSEILKISQSVICDYENNKVDPTANILIKYADYFNVSIDYLTGREEEDGRIIVQELELPSDEKKVLEKYRILPPELKAVSYEYIKSLGNLNEEFDIKRKRNL